MPDTSQEISKAVKNIFKESGEFILIGLTGRTGSGCTTSANILTSLSFNMPASPSFTVNENEIRKFKIISKFIKQNWVPFKCLQMTSVLTRHLLEINFHEFVKLVSLVLQRDQAEILPKLSAFKANYNTGYSVVRNYLQLTENSKEEILSKQTAAFELYFDWLPRFFQQLKEELIRLGPSSYVKIYQAIGDNIRASGQANSSTFNPNKIFSMAKIIDKIVISAHEYCKSKHLPCRLAIDAIRNPYEAIYLKQRHANFFLFSINTDDEKRKCHLREKHKLTDPEIKALDEKEYPEKKLGTVKFSSQNIQRCIEISDIHIHNPRLNEFANPELKAQLGQYIALILHPGLVTPSSLESCMQIAYSAKHASGCISRQVGAVVTDSSYSIKAVGWNNTPQGQVPCLLRSAEDLLGGSDKKAFSNYEMTDPMFRQAFESKFTGPSEKINELGRTCSFCFKEIQNEIDHEKNQVHTRALHAEENAFLQISKSGGQSLKNGILFTTASPCELCAKKAYQLQISEIIYIDPYPGITNKHVISSGELPPKMTLFHGAIGTAFHRIFHPVMPYKDELELLIPIPKPEDKKTIMIKSLELEVQRLKAHNQELIEKVARIGSK